MNELALWVFSGLAAASALHLMAGGALGGGLAMLGLTLLAQAGNLSEACRGRS